MRPSRLAGLGSKTGEMLRPEPVAHGVHGEANLPVEVDEGSRTPVRAAREPQGFMRL
jgi:hypothetical protein